MGFSGLRVLGWAAGLLGRAHLRGAVSALAGQPPPWSLKSMAAKKEDCAASGWLLPKSALDEQSCIREGFQ